MPGRRPDEAGRGRHECRRMEFLHFQGRGHIEMWGRLSTCGPIVNRPGAGPWKLFRCSRQPGRYQVPLDVMNHALKLRIVANQPIIALILPEWLVSESQHSVALPGSESFERLHHLGNCLQWGHQEMNMVRHNDKRMERSEEHTSELQSLTNLV